MEYWADEYDVAVVGGGHAGCEAALAAARLGFKTVMFAINLDSIASLPCNPNIGGTGKGHLVREIDALGGEMGKITDKALIQLKILNRAKGPAVYSFRAQVDRKKYQMIMKNTLEIQDNLDIKQAEVIDILVDESEEKKKIKGLKTHTGAKYLCKTLILATGTYLKAKIIIGDVSFNSGPDGLFPANKLTDSLRENGIELFRFKTGTPARINRKSIDFSKMEEQPGDEVIVPFSFETESIEREQVSCWLIHTNEKTHEIIKDNLHRSPLYSGVIEGTGTRYCPSIEDKIVKFADKPTHQVFVEPMGLGTQEMYLQGMSSSLPEDVQIQMIKTLPGLENVSIMRIGYAIEYDCINPAQLDLSLELKGIDGVFCAGQINGSSGYEEAAAQGLIAGINAVHKLKGRSPVILDRSQAYIGVLIDDLVTKGTIEPYRVMTSRAEYRLLLRQDNAVIVSFSFISYIYTPLNCFQYYEIIFLVTHKYSNASIFVPYLFRSLLSDKFHLFSVLRSLSYQKRFKIINILNLGLHLINSNTLDNYFSKPLLLVSLLSCNWSLTDVLSQLSCLVHLLHYTF
jgi:tRNA uridine 5-carboxymethylaminomethyl modification enzyme